MFDKGFPFHRKTNQPDLNTTSTLEKSPVQVITETNRKHVETTPVPESLVKVPDSVPNKVSSLEPAPVVKKDIPGQESQIPTQSPGSPLSNSVKADDTPKRETGSGILKGETNVPTMNAEPSAKKGLGGSKEDNSKSSKRPRQVQKMYEYSTIFKDILNGSSPKRPSYFIFMYPFKVFLDNQLLLSQMFYDYELHITQKSFKKNPDMVSKRMARVERFMDFLRLAGCNGKDSLLSEMIKFEAAPSLVENEPPSVHLKVKLSKDDKTLSVLGQKKIQSVLLEMIPISLRNLCYPKDLNPTQLTNDLSNDHKDFFLDIVKSVSFKAPLKFKRKVALVPKGVPVDALDFPSSFQEVVSTITNDPYKQVLLTILYYSYYHVSVLTLYIMHKLKLADPSWMSQICFPNPAYMMSPRKSSASGFGYMMPYIIRNPFVVNHYPHAFRSATGKIGLQKKAKMAFARSIPLIVVDPETNQESPLELQDVESAIADGKVIRVAEGYNYNGDTRALLKGVDMGTDAAKILKGLNRKGDAQDPIYAKLGAEQAKIKKTQITTFKLINSMLFICPKSSSPELGKFTRLFGEAYIQLMDTQDSLTTPGIEETLEKIKNIFKSDESLRVTLMAHNKLLKPGNMLFNNSVNLENVKFFAEWESAKKSFNLKSFADDRKQSDTNAG